ncbi:MAG: hypothetical protein M1840_004546 [Geoglossum simile]|nr:MAG: hypothetical protein M1840_004546 [Geoglossum simile]
MFVPRQVKRKASTTKAKRCHPAVTVERPNESPREQRPAKRPRVSELSTRVAPTTEVAGSKNIIYYEEIRYGLELLLSDYTYTEPESQKWLLERERQIEGDRGYIHLSAFLDSPIFARFKPPVTQVALQEALEFCRSEYLELSPDRYHIRRLGAVRPTEYSVDWDAQTIYVEPHLASLALYPSKLIHHLLSHYHAPHSIAPIQHVQAGKRPSYAFVVLSAPVYNIEAHCWPTDWVVLTKAEWRRRDSEYQAIRIKESKPLYCSVGGSSTCQQRPIASVLPSWTKAQSTLVKRDHPTGLLVYLTNLPPSATKSSIATLISRHVDNHLRRLHKPLNREGTVSGDQLGCSTPTSNPTPDTVGLSIMYTDYTPGTTTATIRLASAADAEKVIAALATNRAPHSTKYGCRSRADGGDAGKQGSAVKAELVTGEREHIYWEESVWKGKSGKKRKKRDGQETSRGGLVHDDYNTDVRDGNL